MTNINDTKNISGVDATQRTDGDLPPSASEPAGDNGTNGNGAPGTGLFDRFVDAGTFLHQLGAFVPPKIAGLLGMTPPEAEPVSPERTNGDSVSLSEMLDEWVDSVPPPDFGTANRDSSTAADTNPPAPRRTDPNIDPASYLRGGKIPETTFIEDGFDPETGILTFPDGTTLDLNIPELNSPPEITPGRRNDELYEVFLRYGEDYKLRVVTYYLGGRTDAPKFTREKWFNLQKRLAAGINISTMEVNARSRNFAYSQGHPGGPLGVRVVIGNFIRRVRMDNGVSNPIILSGGSEYEPTPPPSADVSSPEDLEKTPRPLVVTRLTPKPDVPVEVAEQLGIPLYEVLAAHPEELRRRLPLELEKEISARNYLEAANIAFILYWSYETAHLEHRISEAAQGRGDFFAEKSDPDFGTEAKLYKDAAQQLMENIPPQSLAAAKGLSKDLLKDSLFAFFGGETEKSRLLLKKIVLEGRLISKGNLGEAERLFKASELQHRYDSIDAEEEPQLKAVVRVLLVNAYRNLAQYYNLMIDLPGEDFAGADLQPAGKRYVALYHELVADIYRNRELPFKDNWTNIFSYHLAYDKIYFPGIRSDREDTLAEWWYLRFGVVYELFISKPEPEPMPQFQQQRIQEAFGPDNAADLEKRTDLTALHLKGEVSEEIYDDARDYMARVRVHVEEGAELTLFAEETDPEPTNGGGTPTIPSNGSGSPIIGSSGGIEAKASMTFLTGFTTITDQGSFVMRDDSPAEGEIAALSLVSGALTISDVPDEALLRLAVNEAYKVGLPYLVPVIEDYPDLIETTPDEVALQLEECGQQVLVKKVRQYAAHLTPAQLALLSALAVDADLKGELIPSRIATLFIEKFFTIEAQQPTGVHTFIMAPGTAEGTVFRNNIFRTSR